MQTTNPKQAFVYPMPIVRGICILAVILIHVAYGSVRYGQSKPLTLSLVFLNCISRFAVPVFVMLSGFYLSLNPRNGHAKSLYRRTLKFFIIPYIVYSLVYSVFGVRESGDFLIFLKDLLSAQHLWFLILILQFYLIHPMLVRWYHGCSQKGLTVICAFLVQIVWNLSFSQFFHVPDLLARGAPFGARYGAVCFISNVGYFFIGYFLLEKVDKIARLLKNRLITAVGVFCCCSAGAGLAAFWGFPISQRGLEARGLGVYLAQGLLTPLLSIAAFASIYSFLQIHNSKRGPISRILNAFGLYSYGIYCLNGLIMTFIAFGLRRVFMLGMENLFYYIFLYVLTALLSLAATRILSKVPFGRYLT
jgi:surface polysaccharide O-acyltransferase-like enzyme